MQRRAENSRLRSGPDPAGPCHYAKQFKFVAGSTLGRVLGKEGLDLIVVLKFPFAAMWKIDQKRAKQSKK